MKMMLVTLQDYSHSTNPRTQVKLPFQYTFGKAQSHFNNLAKGKEVPLLKDSTNFQLFQPMQQQYTRVKA